MYTHYKCAISIALKEATTVSHKTRSVSFYGIFHVFANIFLEHHYDLIVRNTGKTLKFTVHNEARDTSPGCERI